MSVTDEIVGFYSTILNGPLRHYAGIVGGGAVDLITRPALERARNEHKFLEAVQLKDGRIEAKEISADIEVMKGGFNALTKAIVDSLGYVFGPDQVIKETRRTYKEAAASVAKLIQDAKIAKDLPAFLSEEIWEEV